MREELKRLHQQLRITTVYVTHDQAEAMSLGDFLVVMDKGKVIQYGKPIDVYKNPEHVFVAGFIGNPAMNLIYGWIQEEDGQLLFMNDNLRLKLPQVIENNLKNEPYTSEDEYVLGIRPEHIRTGEESLKAEIIVMEPLGSETLALVKLGGHEVRLRLNNNVFLEPRNIVDCAFPDKNIHLFHGPSGKAIVSG
jgi:multiple sugar transport system ATP-binding protein